MPSLPHWLLAWSLGQNPQSPPPAQPAKTAPAPAVAAAELGKTTKAPPGKPAPLKEVDSPLDIYIKEQAAKLDGIQNASANLVHTMRYFDETVATNGELRLGAGDRIRFEMKIDVAAGKGRYLYLCDGKKSYRVVETGPDVTCHQLDLPAIRALLAAKELADDPDFVNNRMIMMFPYRKPGDMLRGLASSMTFTQRTDETLDGQPVVKLEAEWRPTTLALLGVPAGVPAKSALNDMPAEIPNYLRLVLHKETGWPVLVEVFHRDARLGVVKPIVRLEYKDVKIGAAPPPAAFDFAKENVKASAVINSTEPVVTSLKSEIERRKALASSKASAAKTAPNQPTPPSASVPPPPPAEKK